MLIWLQLLATTKRHNLICHYVVLKNIQMSLDVCLTQMSQTDSLVKNPPSSSCPRLDTFPVYPHGINFVSPLWPIAQLLGGRWEDLATSQCFDASLIKPLHSHDWTLNAGLPVSQPNQTEQTQMAVLSFTCCYTASSLKGKANRAINVCSKPISESGPGSIHFPCYVILDCIIFSDEHAGILGLLCLPTMLSEVLKAQYVLSIRK